MKNYKKEKLEIIPLLLQPKDKVPRNKLTKAVKDLCSENYRILKKEAEEYTHK